MRAQLIPLDGGRPIEICKDLVIVGRREECDLRLEHKSVSKMHCVIVKTDLIADKYARHYQPMAREAPATAIGLDE